MRGDASPRRGLRVPRARTQHRARRRHRADPRGRSSPVLLARRPPRSLEEIAALTALLKSCGALEAFRKARASRCDADRVLEYMLLDRSPPAQRALLPRSAASARSTRSSGGADRPQRARRQADAELSFLESPTSRPRRRLGARARAGAARHRRRRPRDRRAPSSRPACSSRAPSPRQQQRSSDAAAQSSTRPSFTLRRADRRGVHRAAAAPARRGRPALLSFTVETEPRGVRCALFHDHLGNNVGHFDVLEPHERLAVTATSDVLTSAIRRAHVAHAARAPRLPQPTSGYAEHSTDRASSPRSSAAARRAPSLMNAVADDARLREGRHLRADLGARGARRSAAASARTSRTS